MCVKVNVKSNTLKVGTSEAKTKTKTVDKTQNQVENKRKQQKCDLIQSIGKISPPFIQERREEKKKKREENILIKLIVGKEEEGQREGANQEFENKSYNRDLGRKEKTLELINVHH